MAVVRLAICWLLAILLFARALPRRSALSQNKRLTDRSLVVFIITGAISLNNARAAL